MDICKRCGDKPATYLLTSPWADHYGLHTKICDDCAADAIQIMHQIPDTGFKLTSLDHPENGNQD